jgi:hypothetical protein
MNQSSHQRCKEVSGLHTLVRNNGLFPDVLWTSEARGPKGSAKPLHHRASSDDNHESDRHPGSGYPHVGPRYPGFALAGQSIHNSAVK